MAFKAKGSGAPGAFAGRVVSMVAKFNSVCKCGALIEPGDAMSYDTSSRKTLCYVCVKHPGGPSVASAGVTSSVIVEEQPPVVSTAMSEKCYALIDRFRELRLAPRPVSEMTKLELREILKRFIFEFGTNETVRSFVAEIAKCKHGGAKCAPIVSKFHGACIHCVTVSAPGELVMYDHHAKRIHCLLCDCLRGL